MLELTEVATARLSSVSIFIVFQADGILMDRGCVGVEGSIA